MGETDAKKEKAASYATNETGLNTVKNTLEVGGKEYRCAVDGQWHKDDGHIVQRWGEQIRVCARCKTIVEKANGQIREVMPLTDVLNEAS